MDLTSRPFEPSCGQVRTLLLHVQSFVAVDAFSCALWLELEMRFGPSGATFLSLSTSHVPSIAASLTISMDAPQASSRHPTPTPTR